MIASHADIVRRRLRPEHQACAERGFSGNRDLLKRADVPRFRRPLDDAGNPETVQDFLGDLELRISSSSLHGGTAFSTRSIAVSTRTPVNSPDASFSKDPPLGFGVLLSIPAFCSPRLFAIEK